MRRQIYLDNAATTQPDPQVVEAMMPYIQNNYGNPSSLYDIGRNNKKAISKARESVANLIYAKPDEVFFTSGGSEADNWVLKGLGYPGSHIITSKIEHHAILNTCEYLKNYGVEVTYIDVDKNGMVNPADIDNAIKDNTVLISIMFANNEIGSIQPIKEIGEIADYRHIFFHTDAVQAYGHVPIDVNELKIDMLSCSAHKIYGPKGVGALYMRNSKFIVPLIHGGGQEFGLRASTENVMGIVGFGAAAELAMWNLDINMNKERQLTTLLLDLINQNISNVKFNGITIGDQRLSNNLNVSIEGIRGEELLMLLNMNGCYVSTGSACNSSDDSPSHVLKAIGLSDDEANSSIRITIGKYTERRDIIDFVDILKMCVEQLRFK